MSHPRGSYLETPPSYAHAHHTHNPSYDAMMAAGFAEGGFSNENEDDPSSPTETTAARAHAEYSADEGTAFPSPSEYTLRPPTHQRGLQPDPMAAHHPRVNSGSVGRFSVIEGSPLRAGEGTAEQRDAVSPFPMQEGLDYGESPPSPSHAADQPTEHTTADGGEGEIEDDDDGVDERSPTSAHTTGTGVEDALSPHSTSLSTTVSSTSPDPHAHLPHIFFVPRFPSMQVNGAPVTLTLSINVLPRRSVNISPSAPGVEFSPPKLKWMHGQPASMGLARAFVATPLATAREGKCKVSYIVSGDDASEYEEPPPSVLQMFSEDTPLPLPVPASPMSPLQSPGASDGTAEKTAAVAKSKRDAFLAQGVPRQSGRFMVIDEELQGSPSHAAASAASAVAAPGASPAHSGDNPLELLARLQASLYTLLSENDRLTRENTALMQENAELRSRGGLCSIVSPEPAGLPANDPRFPRHTPSPLPSPPTPHAQSHTPQPQQHAQHTAPHTAPRTAHISSHGTTPAATAGAGAGAAPRVRFGSEPHRSPAAHPPSPIGVFAAARGAAHPVGAAGGSGASSPAAAGPGPVAPTSLAPTGAAKPVVMSHDKRMSLPANFQMGAAASAGGGHPGGAHHAHRNSAGGILAKAGVMVHPTHVPPHAQQPSPGNVNLSSPNRKSPLPTPQQQSHQHPHPHPQPQHAQVLSPPHAHDVPRPHSQQQHSPNPAASSGSAQVSPNRAANSNANAPSKGRPLQPPQPQSQPQPGSGSNQNSPQTQQQQQQAQQSQAGKQHARRRSSQPEDLLQ